MALIWFPGRDFRRRVAQFTAACVAETLSIELSIS
jgi:hypothetical protein